MALGPRLDLRQSQSLVMTPQLQQAIKLLALSNLEIESFIGEALEANPLLDIGAEDAGQGQRASDQAAPAEQADTRRTSLDSSPVDQLIGEGRAADDRPLDNSAELRDADKETGDGGMASSPDMGQDFGGGSGQGSGSGQGEGDLAQDYGEAAITLSAHLHGQIGASSHDAALVFVARALIDQLDDAGYLGTPLLDLAINLDVPLAQVEAALTLVQSLDPTGIGARNLGECIALQAREADRYDPPMARLLDNLDLLARGELPRLKRMCGVDDEDFAGMLAELRGYDPKPGRRFDRDDSPAVTPDILLDPALDGGWTMAINQASLPRLIVNRGYYLELKGSCADKGSRAWLSEKLTDANWLIKALDQRQKTILKVAEEVVRHQDGFFRHGVSQLRPLTLRAVAEAVGLHESTVSRVTANKYIQCPRGTFELKYLFTSGVASADGAGTASAEAVKAAIRQLIEAESADAILSDDTLVDLLNAKGFDLARRTVAKYREAIGLGSSVQRRREKKLAGVL